MVDADVSVLGPFTFGDFSLSFDLKLPKISLNFVNCLLDEGGFFEGTWFALEDEVVDDAFRRLHSMHLSLGPVRKKNIFLKDAEVFAKGAYVTTSIAVFVLFYFFRKLVLVTTEKRGISSLWQLRRLLFLRILENLYRVLNRLRSV